MMRQFQTGLALRIEAPNSAAKSLLRGQEEFLAVPRVGLRTAAQNDDVLRGALGGLDGAKSILVAALGYVTDQDESPGRALGAGRLEEEARLPEGIPAPLFSGTAAFAAAACPERSPQALDGVPRVRCHQRVPRRGRTPRRCAAPIPTPAPAIEHGVRGRGRSWW